MIQISNATHAALLRHLPVVAGEGLRSGDKRIYRSSYMLMQAYKVMLRRERRDRKAKDYGKEKERQIHG